MDFLSQILEKVTNTHSSNKYLLNTNRAYRTMLDEAGKMMIHK